MGAREYQIYFECWTYLTSERSERVRYQFNTRNKSGISKHPYIFLFII
jgi:hypothetical protein